MIITQKTLDRRSFLRGAGAAVALPFLDAMVPALPAKAAQTVLPAQRMSYVYLPMGAHLEKWIPPTTGALTHLPPILQPLDPLRDEITVISNLEIKNAYSLGNHATANSAFLSAAKAKMTEGSDYELAITVDQIAAQRIGRETPLPSLELAMDLNTVVGNCDNGYACVYQNNLSWSSPTSPLPPEAHPQMVFQRLFGSDASPEARRAEMRKNASILDWVLEDMSRLQRELGPSDRSKVDDYLASIREVERRIQMAERRVADAPVPDVDRPEGVPADYGDHARLMFDLQVLALQGDLTRIMTFQLARETSDRTYPEIGVPDEHHYLSHHGNRAEKLEKLATINTYHVSLFGYYLEKLRSTPDGDGALLDHMQLLFGSGMGNPDVHDHIDMPILVAGGAITSHSGRHIRYDQPTPMANLHLTMLNKANVTLESFADSTGMLTELDEPRSA